MTSEFKGVLMQIAITIFWKESLNWNSGKPFKKQHQKEDIHCETQTSRSQESLQHRNQEPIQNISRYSLRNLTLQDIWSNIKILSLKQQKKLLVLKRVKTKNGYQKILYIKSRKEKNKSNIKLIAPNKLEALESLWSLTWIKVAIIC